MKSEIKCFVFRRASEVKLLYDKRQNSDLKDLLFDPGMREWQGPSIWVYNNQGPF